MSEHTGSCSCGAAVHVNYGEAVVRVHDGLPKQKDFPAEMGGSGTILPE